MTFQLFIIFHDFPGKKFFQGFSMTVGTLYLSTVSWPKIVWQSTQKHTFKNHQNTGLAKKNYTL